MSKLTIEIDSEQPLDSKIKIDNVQIGMVAAIHLSSSERSITLFDIDCPDIHNNYLKAYEQLYRFKNIINIRTMRLY